MNQVNRKFEPLNNVFCCPKMYNGLIFGSSLKLINEQALKMGYVFCDYFEKQELKLNQVYLINDETGELEGEPFKFCPYCGTNINV